MKVLILVTLLMFGFMASKAETIMRHAEIANKVDSLYVQAFVQSGWTYKITYNSKKQLIYVFTKTVK